MSSDSRRPFLNGGPSNQGRNNDVYAAWNESLENVKTDPEFHGNKLLADKEVKLTGIWTDLSRIFTWKNAPAISAATSDLLRGKGLNVPAFARLIGSVPNESKARAGVIDARVKGLYDQMLHPPLTYLGDAFQHRAVDGKYNSVLHPHLGAAGAPYARTVESKTHALGALPDPGDVYDKVMARTQRRDSPSGLSSMLVYHATIIIHDIFRSNEKDKNISDSSSYLDLSPLYGYTKEMETSIRDGKYKMGLLKPDTFAEDRLLRQPPGVCIMLVMYNRYHNYAATQLRRINENGRFSIPAKFNLWTKWLAVAESKDCFTDEVRASAAFKSARREYREAWRKWYDQGQKKLDDDDKDTEYAKAEGKFKDYLYKGGVGKTDAIDLFVQQYDDAWTKLDDDLYNTARLITCGIYINVAIHDYLRALMGFHQFNTNFTLDPRTDIDHHQVSRGIGNQVTVEFNLLYRFHCAISRRDETYAKAFLKEQLEELGPQFAGLDPDDLPMEVFGAIAAKMSYSAKAQEPSKVEFGLQMDKKSPPPPAELPDPSKGADSEPGTDPSLQLPQTFKRNTITGLFDDQQMIDQLVASMQDPISNFGPRNVPKCLRIVEMMGMRQARKWDIGTLNDFRDFFGLGRHESFETISKNKDVQDALRDLYDHPDKVELYPGIFCESDKDMNVDPGPSGIDSALWSAIFSDAITLVRSDRFYTVDWNTKSLTSWGMKEVTPDNDVSKSSVFHRLIQRSFPEWFPFDSIRFFHPFYTGKQNCRYALEQGYKDTYRFEHSRDPQHPFSYGDSEPAKPTKPTFLTNYDDILKVLSTSANEIIHPAFALETNLPASVRRALQPISETTKTDPKDLTKKTLTDKSTIRAVKAYFAHQMRRMIEREVISMGKDKVSGDPVYQVDATRDLAIPVITRCIADFLGFGHQIRDVDNKHAKYSENEIYQHITNCQTFLSYNADETKLLKRRTDFKNSMQFLTKLAEEGNISEARRWRITDGFVNIGKFIAGLFKSKKTSGDDAATDPMKALGRAVALHILEKQNKKDVSKAAAILLLTALDIAYISVLAKFTASLDHLLEGAYDLAAGNKDGSEDWFHIQEAVSQQAKNESEEDVVDAYIENLLLKAQNKSIKLPFIRKVVKSGGLEIALDGKTPTLLDKGTIIVCDVYAAMNPPKAEEKRPHLSYVSSLSAGIIDFNPKDIATHGLTAMVKVMAQTKDLRRGHDSQGKVKRIEIDQTSEGYANFMGPGRVQEIKHDAERAPIVLKKYEEKLKSLEPPKSEEEKKEREAHLAYLKKRVEQSSVYTTKVLKPKQDTYLTAEWDEMVPFPTTWKLRFDGYGDSTYGPDRIKLKPARLPDDMPPFYQPSGPSHYGGAFGHEHVPVSETPAGGFPTLTAGCGAGAGHKLN